MFAFQEKLFRGRCQFKYHFCSYDVGLQVKRTIPMYMEYVKDYHLEMPHLYLFCFVLTNIHFVVSDYFCLPVYKVNKKTHVNNAK